MQRGFHLALMILAAVPPLQAQNARIAWDELGLVYVEAKFQRTYQAFIDRNGEYIPPREILQFSVPSDTLLVWIRETMGLRSPEPTNNVFEGKIDSWKLASLEDRAGWLRRFGDIQWSYLGNNYFTPLDTVPTATIRAYMQAYLGSPTQTAVEIESGDPTPVDENGQFEYWLTVNDSIPMIVMDVRGPFDYGIIVATDHQFRSELYRMRQSLLVTAMHLVEPERYVDYYYDLLTEKWYLTGYDGTEYFLRPTRRPKFEYGRPALSGSQGRG